MAFSALDLSVLAYANNFTLWHFVTSDADVSVANYFDAASDKLSVNDLIIANVDTDGTPATTFYVVSSNDGGNVTIAAY